jgi:hypothetical protein
MDEVSFHSPETKQQSKKWLEKVEKGKLRPIKAKVHVTREKQMVLGCFNSKASFTPTPYPGGKQSMPSTSLRPPPDSREF